MKSMKRFFFILLAVSGCFQAMANEVTGSQQWEWGFLPGADVPGASGALTESEKGLTINFDFSKGGSYVLAQLSASFPGNVKSFSMEVDTQGLTQPVSLAFRVSDATGRWFSGGSRQFFPPDKKNPFTFDATIKSWDGHWLGGQAEHDARSPEFPLRTFGISVEKNASEPKGAVTLSNFKAITPSGFFNNPTATGTAFKGSPFMFDGSGWTVSGVWKADSMERIVLSVSAVPSAVAAPATLSISFPTASEMKTLRYALTPGKTQSFTYQPPFEYVGGNPNNIYRIEVGLENASSSSKTWVELRGNKASASDLGQAVTSAQVADSNIGVCTHLGFATYETAPSPAYINGIMRNHTSLLDMVSRSGIKWIRDNLCLVDRTKDGGFRIRPYDLDWIREAQARKIRVIACIMEDSYPPESLPDFARKCQDIAVQSQELGLNLVFEFGNEPQGVWAPKYAEAWNGKGPDNSASKWVLEHLKYTNAGAEAIKKVCPKAIVIGLGAPACVNFRELRAGVSHALDGVADHCYSMTFPPEQVPWAKQLLARDGIEVGDESGSIEGFIASYQNEFQKTGHPGMGLWITECGFPSNWNTSSNEGLYNLGLTEEAQAAYLARLLIIYQTMPVVKVAAIHNLIDIAANPFDGQARFGLLHNDETPKPAYRTVSRVASLFNGHEPDPGTVAKVDAPKSQYNTFFAAPAFRQWDGASIPLVKGFRAYAFKPKGAARTDFLALWAGFELGDMNNIGADITISGSLLGQVKHLVAIDLVTGLTFDVPFKVVDGKLVVVNFVFGRHPLILRLYYS